MEVRMRIEDWLFLLLCIGLGILAEETFTRGEVGISHFIFIAAFYAIFFWRFRGFPYRNQRLGWLVLGAVWLLSASYSLYDMEFFQALNILAIPALVIFHISLITGPKHLEWAKPVFLVSIMRRIGESIAYNAAFARLSSRLALHRTKSKNAAIIKKVFIGIGVSIPVLAVVLNLLISADSEFERIVTGFPAWFRISGESIFRILFTLFSTFAIFGFLQVHLKKRYEIKPAEGKEAGKGIDPVILLTVLFLLDAVYVLFVGVQFTYFFSGTLSDGYTFAEYARRGFFELVFVSVINLSVTVFVLSFAKNPASIMKRLIQASLSILVLSSGIILSSAFMRLMMYEEAYGYTFLRVLIHSFMIFLLIIFCYTLAKIWLDRLSLFHFYFIAAIVYYTAINIIHIDQIVVDRNMERFEQTGKIDLQYLAYMSDTGILALSELYKEQPNLSGLKELLNERKSQVEAAGERHWQSYNLTREKAKKAVLGLNLE
ncbi:DUF4173 domain-containing protein [Neobacillus notoginsengisoli]|uniref:DUF4173 domain-containing protein n=1 Tax=Neobacillus notoginsengisoli TaxID=1578198 RepID=A0A417YX84_9BACI|nr:DUF4173 domain-containing protein [Neobacillus notoginsengisoli]RHW42042.1 DUF4173 domain-containing protein [Neobacillus notoginsengisoli]